MQAQVARASFERGVRFGEMDRNSEAVTAYSQLVSRFGDTDHPAIQKEVGMALVNKAARLGKLGRHQEAVATYNEVVNASENRPIRGSWNALLARW